MSACQHGRMTGRRTRAAHEGAATRHDPVRYADNGRRRHAQAQLDEAEAQRQASAAAAVVFWDPGAA